MSQLLELVQQIGEIFALRTKLVSEYFVWMMLNDSWEQLRLSRICVVPIPFIIIFMQCFPFQT
jgi:hypothetical protein